MCSFPGRAHPQRGGTVVFFFVEANFFEAREV